MFVGCPKKEISRKNGREEKAFTVVLVGFLKTGVRPEGEEDVGRQEAADIPKQAGGFVFLTFSLFRRPYFLLRVRIRSCLYGFVKGRTKRVAERVRATQLQPSLPTGGADVQKRSW